MMKNPKTLLAIFTLGILACFTMTACSSAQASQANAGSGSAQPQASQLPSNNRAIPLEGKLAFGTLQLEGTDLAVTAEEAKNLLPLWQQIQTLNADSQATPETIQAVYQQIESAMSADQIKKIENMTFSRDDIQAMRTKLGIQSQPGRPQDPNGGGPQAGTPPANPQPQGTPGAGMNGRGGPRGGMDREFITALIALLQSRSAS